MQDEVLATIQASSARRWTGVGLLILVGASVIYVAFVSPPQPVWQIFLLVFGGGAFWLAHRMWQATFDRIILTRSELKTGQGVLIAKVQDIEAVDRGVFAFKPSNGFVIRTHSKQTTSWAPGLWWRVGRRVGIGGMTAAAETKVMADVLSVHLAES